MTIISIKQQCHMLLRKLQYIGDAEDDNAVMNFLLRYCLKRTLQTKWKDYLIVWKRLRCWEQGTMTYTDFAFDLEAIISIDTAYEKGK
ncbi:hypothetical protein [Nostoc sp.]|uniref:hypothetical protein n=1 Tax=Nostoc sp. TaxID=1180 RepID=UPI002FFC4280